MNDLRYALRRLTHSPGFAAAAVAVLAIGIGAMSTVFSGVNAVLLRGLPGTDPDRLVRIFALEPQSGRRSRFSYAEYLGHRDHNRTFEGLFGVAGFEAGFSAAGISQLVLGELVTANFFDVLRVNVSPGRSFLPDEGRAPQGSPVAVISHDLWQRLGGRPGIVGRVARVNGRPVTIVGVAEASFRGTNIALARDLWMPITLSEDVVGMSAGFGSDETATDGGLISLLGRLRPGVTPQQASADLTGMARRLFASDGEAEQGVNLRVLPERVGLINPDRPQLVHAAGTMMVAVVGLGLLIACANVASMLLARAVARRREIGIRLALGANRQLLLRQLLAESLVLAIPAGILGLLLAAWAAPVYTAFLPADTTLALDFAPDGRVVAFTALVSLLATLIFGLLPALHASRPELVPALKGDGGASSRPGQSRRFLEGVVVIQLALSLVVLLVAGLFLRELRWREEIDPGFEIGQRLILAVDLRTLGLDAAAGDRLARDLEERLQALPGVRRVTVAARPPMALHGKMDVLLADSKQDSSHEAHSVAHNAVSHGYFKTLGLPVLRGRTFGPEDGMGSVPVAIVNETMARRLWPQGSAVGARIRTPLDDLPLEVVGVVADAKYTSLDEAPRPFFYVPLAQHPHSALTFHLKTHDEPVALAPQVREEVKRVDPTLPIARLLPLSQHVAEDLVLARTLVALAGLLGGAVLVMASVGLFGVVSFVVGRRTRELAIRAAVGARSGDLLRLIMGQALRLLGAGLACGLLMAAGFGTLLSDLLLGVSPFDAPAYAAIVLLLTAVALAAAYLPARRAAQVDPLQSLRYE